MIAQPFSETGYAVLCLVAAGYSNKQVAARLHYSRETIHHYVNALLHHTGTRNRTQLALWAIRNNVLSVAEAWYLAQFVRPIQGPRGCPDL